jgi:hypothetical protein
MFDQESAIREWRRQMRAAGLMEALVLDELESHLREAIDRRVGAGDEASYAFEFAARELGDGRALKREFARTSRGRSMPERLMLAAYVVLMGFIVFLAGATVVLCFSSLTDRIVSGVGMAATLITASLWSRAVRFLPVVSDTRMRAFISLICILVGICISTFYCQVVLPLFGQPYDHQIAAAGFWMLLPVAAGVGLGCGFDVAGRRQAGRSA